MAFNLDQALQGFSQQAAKTGQVRAAQQQRAAEQAQRLQEILLKEELTRERDEIKRRAAVNTERGTKEKVNSRVKASERNALLNNIQSAMGLGRGGAFTTGNRFRPNLEADFSLPENKLSLPSGDPLQQALRPRPRQRQQEFNEGQALFEGRQRVITGINELDPQTRAMADNILLGTKGQQFTGTNEFRTKGRVIDPTARIRREQSITKENTRLAQEDAKDLEKENITMHEAELKLLDSEIAVAKLERDGRKNITPEAKRKIQKLLAKKRKLVLLGPQSHSAEGFETPVNEPLEKFRKRMKEINNQNKIGRFEIVE